MKIAASITMFLYSSLFFTVMANAAPIAAVIDEVGKNHDHHKDDNHGGSGGSMNNIVEAIQVHIDTATDPSELNDLEKGFLRDALIFTFDETHPEGKAVFAYLDHIDAEGDEDAAERTVAQQKGLPTTNSKTRLTNSYPSWYYYYILFGCGIFCNDDDYTSESAVLRSAALGSKKALEHWADNLCGALRDSSYEVFADADECIIVVNSGNAGGIQ